jgi:hypothetical protein
MHFSGGYDAARQQISSWREKGEELHGSSAGEGVGGGGAAFFSRPDAGSRGTGGTTLVFSSRAPPAKDAQGVAAAGLLLRRAWAASLPSASSQGRTRGLGECRTIRRSWALNWEKQHPGQTNTARYWPSITLPNSIDICWCGIWSRH